MKHLFDDHAPKPSEQVTTVTPITDQEFRKVFEMNDSDFIRWCYAHPFPSKSGLSSSQVDSVMHRLCFIQGKRYLKTGDIRSFTKESLLSEIS